MHQIEVTKIGGTRAVEFQSNFRVAAEKAAAGVKQVEVFSVQRAEKNTTSQLIEAAKAAGRGKQEEALRIVGEIRQFFDTLIENQIEDAYKTALRHVIETQFASLTHQLQTLAALPEENRQRQLVQVEDSFVFQNGDQAFPLSGWGEILAQELYVTYFRLNGLRVASLDLLGEVSSFREQLATALADHDIVVTGGYNPELAKRRGYTELKTAEISLALGEAGHRVSMDVHKEDPVMDRDPRAERSAQVVEELDWDTARALCSENGAHAGVIHAGAVDRLAAGNVEVRVFNPDHLDRGITRIHKGARADAARIVIRKGTLVYCVGRGFEANRMTPLGARSHENLPLWTISGEPVSTATLLAPAA